jgi:hypothetical protein
MKGSYTIVFINCQPESHRICGYYHALNSIAIVRNVNAPNRISP